jgi:hypothetical protein
MLLIVLISHLFPIMVVGGRRREVDDETVVVVVGTPTVTALIVFSALITVLETVPTFHSVSNRGWSGVETTLVALFTVEYIDRCLTWSFSWSSLVLSLLCEYSVFVG